MQFIFKDIADLLLHRNALELQTMPFRQLLAQTLVDKLLLLHRGEALEFGRFDADGKHGSAATADVLHEQVLGFEISLEQ